MRILRGRIGYLSGLVALAGLAIAPQAQAKLIKISTITASASASIQFTGLNSTYDSYFLNCVGLLGSAAAGMSLFVGEGGGPTWETSANYTQQAFWTGAGNAIANSTNTTTGANANTAIAGNGSTTVPQSLRAKIDNPSSTTIPKEINFESAVFIDTQGEYYTAGVAYWNSDTGAITGLEIVPTSGNIAAGVCTLYGLTK